MHGFAKTARLFFDVTDIISYSGHSKNVSGIQRVVIQVISSMRSARRELVHLVALDGGTGQFREVDADLFDGARNFDRGTFRRRLGLRRKRSWRDVVTRYRGRPGKILIHGLRHPLLQFRWRQIKESRLVDIRAGDAFVVLGSPWDVSGHPEALSDLAGRGVSITTFVHDLIPLNSVEHVHPHIIPIFRPWLDHAYRVSSHLLTNSESSANDLKADMERTSARKIDITTVPLAHEFPTNTTGDMRTEVLRFGLRPFVLCVGTIESRKNPWGVARVWQALEATLKFETPTLVLAGKEGWLISDFKDVMRSTGNVYGHVRMLTDASDAELAWLYRNCMFTVYPSFYEGWGLPVGESLWFGKTCAASKTSSMPEVGGDMCAYVDPHDLDDIYATVLRLIQDEGFRLHLESKITRERLRTWADVATDILDAVTRPSSTPAFPA